MSLNSSDQPMPACMLAKSDRSVEVSLLPQEAEQVELAVNDIKGIRPFAAGHNLARRSWLRGKGTCDDLVHVWSFETTEPVMPSCKVQGAYEENEEMVKLTIGEDPARPVTTGFVRLMSKRGRQSLL